MQRAIWFVAPVIALAMSIAPLSTTADSSDYVAPDDAEAKIKAYYDDVFRSNVRRIYLLEIVRADDEAELMYVYFLKDKDPKVVDDPRGNISALTAPVYKATFHYSYLGGEWRIKEIKRYRGKIVFRYEG
jgi:hypothetical protein